jgi:hypothetical protein
MINPISCFFDVFREQHPRFRGNVSGLATKTPHEAALAFTIF